MTERNDDRSRLQRDLDSDPSGEAETIRIASGKPNEDATDATEAETPDEALRQISDPTPGASSAKPDAAKDGIERATAAVGSDETEKPNG